MKTTKPIIAMLCLPAMLLSCGESAIQQPETTAEVQSEVTTERDSLPELDFGGKTLHFFLADYEITNAKDDFVMEAEDGDIVHDAVYRRNRAVEERLNLNIEWNDTHFDYGSRDLVYNAIRESVMSGDNTMDIISIPSYFMSTLVLEGLLTDMNTLPYIDFDREWWYDGFNDTAEVNGKRYMATGDGSLPYLKGMYALLFNKKIGKDYNIEVPYQTVLDGKWTLDVMSAMVKDVYSDLNGNQTADENDLYGVEFMGNNYVYPFMEATGTRAFDMTQKGDARFIFGNEHNCNVVEKMCEFLNNTQGVYLPKVSFSNAGDTLFYNGHAMICGLTIGQTDIYREVNFEYGILPYPKFDDTQEEYYTRANTGTSVFAVPMTAEPEIVGAFLEALASESHFSLLPTYFEVALKIKYSSDDETSQVLDLIRNGVKVDFGGVFAAALGGPTDKFRAAISENNPQWASTCESMKESVLQKLDTLLAVYE